MSNPLHRSKRSKAYALLLVNTILWGIAPPIIKVALRFVSINQFLFGRYLIAALIFVPIYFITRRRLKPPHLTRLILLGLLGTPLTLIPLYEGIKLTTSIDSSLIYATIPVMAVIGGWLFLHEKIEKHEQIGLLIAMAGTFLLIVEPLLHGSVSLAVDGSARGNFLILISNLVWVAFLLLAKKYKSNAEDVSLVSYIISIPFFLILSLNEPAAVLSAAQPTHPLALFGILYMAIFGSIIAFWAYTKGQTYIEAGEASIFTYLQPLFTFPLAYFWLHESISYLSIIACVIIAAGVYLSEYHHH